MGWVKFTAKTAEVPPKAVKKEEMQERPRQLAAASDKQVPMEMWNDLFIQSGPQRCENTKSCTPHSPMDCSRFAFFGSGADILLVATFSVVNDDVLSYYSTVVVLLTQAESREAKLT